MFALLQPIVAESDLRVAIVLNRGINAGGNTLCYFLALAHGESR